MDVHLPYGAASLRIQMETDRLLGVFAAPEAEPIDNIAEAARRALRQPTDAPPLEQAAVPGDRVAIVVDEPQRGTPTGPLVTTIVRLLQRAGVRPADVTLLVSRPSQAWVPGGDLAALAGAFAGQVKIEVHNPTEPLHLAYLAGTRGGQRVYLNRTLVDADLVILCGQVSLDPVTGFTGGPVSLMPGLSDTESWERRGMAAHRGGADAARFVDPLAQEEAQEVARLLGVPYAVQVVMGAGNDAIGLFAGRPEDAFARATDFYRRHWFHRLEEPAELAIACVNAQGPPRSLAEVLPALTYVRQAVRTGGRIALVCPCRHDHGLGRWAQTLARADQPSEVRRRLAERHGPIEMGLMALLETAGQATLNLLSDLDAESVDEWFMTALPDTATLEHLAAEADSVAVIPQADQALVWYDSSL